MKYVDITAIIQVIGCIYQNPTLLDNENYFFHEEDFTEEFHKILFGSMFNLHALGAKEVSINTIEGTGTTSSCSIDILQTIFWIPKESSTSLIDLMLCKSGCCLNRLYIDKLLTLIP